MPVIACYCRGPNELNPHLQDQRHRRPKQSGRPCLTMPSNGCMRTQIIGQLLMLKGNIMFLIIFFILIFLSCISQSYSLKRNNKHSHAMKSRSWSTGLNISVLDFADHISGSSLSTSYFQPYPIHSSSIPQILLSLAT